MDRLEELLAACNSMRVAEKPLSRSQSELALAAVLTASLVVGSSDQQSQLPANEHPGSRTSSLPTGVPSYLPPQAPRPSSLSCASVQTLPPFMSQVNGNLVPVSKLAASQADRLPIKTDLYKVRGAHPCRLVFQLQSIGTTVSLLLAGSPKQRSARSPSL